MFIQITEPEEVKEKIAIGIDFGTTHSVVGIKRSDKVELIANEWYFIDIFSLEDIHEKICR
jgi:hypothetical protein